MFFPIKNTTTTNIIIGHNNAKNMYSGVPIQTHAEIDGAKKILQKNKGKNQKYNLLLIRYTPGGNFGNSYPCHNCVKQLSQFSKFFQIKKVYYTNENKLHMISFKQILKTNFCNPLSSGYRYRFKQ